ncbi:MAG: type III pantothenate kinase, partial [Nitrospiria bacterium]
MKGLEGLTQESVRNEHETVLLAIDIGNTNIVFGLFKGEKLFREWRVTTDPHKTSDGYGNLLTDFLSSQQIALSTINGAVLSSVVPCLTPIFQQVTERTFSLKAMVVTHSLKTGLKIQCRHPDEVGADRIVNAAAAYHLYGGPVVVVDFGTATTFCVVSKEGDYLGGAIVPGLMLSAEALFSHAAKLPRVELKRPSSVIGKDTVTSMQSGIIFGYIGLVNEIIKRIHHEMGEKTLVVATGGLAGLIASECGSISKIRPTLTLEGLMII